jgi:hypothetical protein
MSRGLTHRLSHFGDTEGPSAVARLVVGNIAASDTIRQARASQASRVEIELRIGYPPMVVFVVVSTQNWLIIHSLSELVENRDGTRCSGFPSRSIPRGCQKSVKTAHIATSTRLGSRHARFRCDGHLVQRPTHPLAGDLIAQFAVEADRARVERVDVQLDRAGAFGDGPRMDALHEHAPDATAAKA